MADDKQAVTVELDTSKLLELLSAWEDSKRGAPALAAWGKVQQHIDAHTAAAVAAERDRCAKLATQWGMARNPEGGGNALFNFAEAVRLGIPVDERDTDYHWSKSPVAKAAAQAAPIAASGDPLAVLTLGGIDGDEFDCWDLEVFSGDAIDKLQEQLVRSDKPVVLNLYAAELAAHTQQPAAVPAEQVQGDQPFPLAWSHSQRVAEARQFLKTYSDANTLKLLDYEVQPIIRVLASMIGQWQQAAAYAMSADNCAAQPPAGELPVLPDLVSTLSEYLQREMPAGTVIGDPAWWAPRIAKAIATRQPAPVADTPSGNWPKDFRDVIKNAEEVASQLGRAAGIEEAAKALHELHKTISDPLVIGQERAEGGHNALDYAEIAIRALNRTGAA